MQNLKENWQNMQEKTRTLIKVIVVGVEKMKNTACVKIYIDKCDYDMMMKVPGGRSSIGDIVMIYNEEQNRQMPY